MGKEYMLVEEGHKPAVWMSELDQTNNAGAHLNSKSFVKADGSYGEIDEMSKPQAQDLAMDWASADTNKM